MKNTNHICTFPDYTKVPVEILEEIISLDTPEVRFNVRWTSEQGLTSNTVVVPSEWVSLRVHPVTESV